MTSDRSTVNDGVAQPLNKAVSGKQLRESAKPAAPVNFSLPKPVPVPAPPAAKK
jgi:hypothetical protein